MATDPDQQVQHLTVHLQAWRGQNGHNSPKMEESQEWFIAVTTFFGLSSLINGILCLILLRHKKPLSAELILLTNALGTNALDATLLYLSQVIEKSLDLSMFYLQPSELLRDQSCDYKKRWSITLHLGMPFKIAAHCATNTLGIAICLYVNNLFIGPYGRVRYMSRRRARDFVILSWILSFFLMWHPMLISCSDEWSFQFVLYTWIGYAVLSVSLSTGLCIASCSRAFCKNDRRANVMNVMNTSPNRSKAHGQSRMEVALLFVQILLLTTTLLPWPALELMEVKGFKEYISKLYQAILVGDWVATILKPILRNLPYTFYLIQPIVLTLGYKEMWEALKSITARVASNLRPNFRPEVDRRITAV